MCMKCGSLIKAIDAYLQKADSGLSDALEEEGYVKPKKTVEYIQDLEDKVTEAFLEETDYFLAEAEKAVDLETFAEKIWPGILLNDDLKEKLAEIFTELLSEFMPEFVGFYIAHNGMGRELEQRPRRDYEAQ